MNNNIVRTSSVWAKINSQQLAPKNNTDLKNLLGLVAVKWAAEKVTSPQRVAGGQQCVCSFLHQNVHDDSRGDLPRPRRPSLGPDWREPAFGIHHCDISSKIESTRYQSSYPTSRQHSQTQRERKMNRILTCRACERRDMNKAPKKTLFNGSSITHKESTKEQEDNVKRLSSAYES